MALATTIDNAILDHFFSKSTWTAPAQIWLGLSSTTPTKAGANVTEPSTGGYTRIQLTAAQMDAAAASATSNNTEKAFPQASADYLAGADITALVLYSAVTGGTYLGSKLIAVPKPVISGDTAKYPVGDLDFAVAGAA